MIFPYTGREMEYLRGRDAKLGAWIDRLGHIRREMIPEPFAALMHAVTGQQVSSKAQASVWARLLARGLDRPEAVLAMPEDELSALGLGPRKARWLRLAAQRADELQGLDALSDAEVIRRLTSFAGVGSWTAEMLMIFSLGRMNVLSQGDLGIRRGLCALHGPDACARFDFWRERYAPYGSVASLYLWEIARLGDADAQI